MQGDQKCKRPGLFILVFSENLTAVKILSLVIHPEVIPNPLQGVNKINQ